MLSNCANRLLIYRLQGRKLCAGVIFTMLIIAFRYYRNDSSLGKPVAPENALVHNWILLEDKPTSTYFKSWGAASCFEKGTNWNKTRDVRSSTCFCVNSYFGKDCGVPATVWFSQFRQKHKLKKRRTLRRIIYGTTVNHELDVLEMVLEELHEVVDVFIVAESNYSIRGDGKDPVLLRSLQRGDFLVKFLHQIVYVFQDHYPPLGLQDGWFAQHYARDYMFAEGMRRIGNSRHDDIFVLFDVDEIPSKDVLLFLKMYDEYSFPIDFRLRWTIFGFFWTPCAEPSTTVTAVVNLRLLTSFMFGNLTALRKRELMRSISAKFSDPEFASWTVGNRNHFGGFHCSWCLPVGGIRKKLVDANREDKPRWGDRPEKLQPAYISRLVQRGMWFDDVTHFCERQFQNSSKYAPLYALNHPKKFSYLLFVDRNDTFVDEF